MFIVELCGHCICLFVAEGYIWPSINSQSVLSLFRQFIPYRLMNDLDLI